MQGGTTSPPLALLLTLPLALAAPDGSAGNVFDTAGLNSVPHLGRKRTLDLPSFTSGFLPPKYPKFLRPRASKREEGESQPPAGSAWAKIMASRPASMFNNVPGKRRPWTSSWANIMVKPEGVYQHGQGKRAPWTSSWANIMVKPEAMYKGESKRMAIPSDWGAGYDNLLRSPQGFRFHSGGQDYMARDLMFKRAKEVVDVTPTKEKKDDSTDMEKKDDTASKVKKDADPALPVETQEESHEEPEVDFDPFAQQWLENFESLMADASLVSSCLALLPPSCFHASS